MKKYYGRKRDNWQTLICRLVGAWGAIYLLSLTQKREGAKDSELLFVGIA